MIIITITIIKIIIEPGTHWWKASALTATSSLLPESKLYLAFGDSLPSIMHSLLNNYLPKAKLILSNNPQDDFEGIIQQYSLSLRGIIVLV